MRDFYATSAQVLPILMLASLWESRFLINIRSQPRRPRRIDQISGVRFWYKSRVRYFLITVAGGTTLGTALSVLALGGVLPDTAPLRAVICAFALLALGTLLTRVVIDIVGATATEAAPGPATDRPETTSPS